MPSTVKTFRQALCEKLEIPAEAFEETVLWQCLPPQHSLIGKIRWRFSRAYFDKDLELVRAVGDCTTSVEVRREIEYQRSTGQNKGFQRGLLRARVSGQRLLDLAHECLAHG